MDLPAVVSIYIHLYFSLAKQQTSFMYYLCLVKVTAARAAVRACQILCWLYLLPYVKVLLFSYGCYEKSVFNCPYLPSYKRGMKLFLVLISVWQRESGADGPASKFPWWQSTMSIYTFITISLFRPHTFILTLLCLIVLYTSFLTSNHLHLFISDCYILLKWIWLHERRCTRRRPCYCEPKAWSRGRARPDACRTEAGPGGSRSMSAATSRWWFRAINQIFLYLYTLTL